MKEDVNNQLLEAEKDEEEIEDLNNSVRVIVSSTMGFWTKKHGNTGFRASMLEDGDKIRLNKTIREKHHAYERILSLLACNPSYLHSMYKKYVLPSGELEDEGTGRTTRIPNHVCYQKSLIYDFNLN